MPRNPLMRGIVFYLDVIVGGWGNRIKGTVKVFFFFCGEKKKLKVILIPCGKLVIFVVIFFIKALLKVDEVIISNKLVLKLQLLNH